MILLIDGYNLIKSTYAGEKFITREVRNSLVNKLNAYCRKKRHEAIVVFDGGDFGFWTKENEGRVAIVYSGYKDSADKVIKYYLEEGKGKEVLLVSSDRELQKFAKSLNIDFISAQSFFSILSQNEQENKSSVIKSKDLLFKTSKNSDTELDELMEELIGIANKNDTDIIAKKDRESNKQSKKDKKLNKKIKKL